MKVIFIAGPYRGDGSRDAKYANIELARKYVRKFIEHEIAFYSPHLNLNQEAVKFDEDKSAYAIEMNHSILRQCDALAVLPGWRDSGGTLGEIEIMKSRSKEIFYLDEEDALSKILSYCTTPL